MKIKVKPGESVEKILKILKKKLDRESILKSARNKRFYSKPSIRMREKSKAALKYKRR